MTHVFLYFWFELSHRACTLFKLSIQNKDNWPKRAVSSRGHQPGGERFESCFWEPETPGGLWQKPRLEQQPEARSEGMRRLSRDGWLQLDGKQQPVNDFKYVSDVIRLKITRIMPRSRDKNTTHKHLVTLLLEPEVPWCCTRAQAMPSCAVQ